MRRLVISLLNELAAVSPLGSVDAELSGSDPKLAEILAEVYLAMTGGQAALALDGLSDAQRERHESAEPMRAIERVAGMVLAVVAPTDEEREAHERLVAQLGDRALWTKI